MLKRPPLAPIHPGAMVACTMAKALQWNVGEDKMNLQDDLFAWFTIAKKR